MTVFYSNFSSTSPVEGRSRQDLTAISLADLFAQASTYSEVVAYSKGTLVYNQGSIWVYINNTPSTGNAPPQLPIISSTYWELVGSTATNSFTWIAYANSSDGSVEFTTNSWDTGGIERSYLGLAVNKSTASESTNPLDYTWQRFAGLDGSSGSDGLNNARPLIYIRSSTAPTLPTATCTYTFSTSALVGLNNGWTLEIPADNGLPCWVTSATAASTTDTDTINSSEWASPVQLVSSGSDGISTATLYLYKRATSQPSLPADIITYTFSTGFMDNITNGWSQSAPANDGSSLWITQATAIGTGSTDTIGLAEWTEPVVLATNGTNGTNGVDGTAAISGYLTNETTALFATANGVVINYASASGQFKVISGSTDVSSAFNLSTVSNPQGLTVVYSGQTYSITGGFDYDEDTATIQIRATGSGVYLGVTIDKVYSLSKTKGGYEIVASLPTSNNFTGRVVFLTIDSKLYRYTGTKWTSAIYSEDLATQIDSDQIKTGAITTDKLDVGAVTAAKIDVTELSAITGTIGLLRTATTGARTEIEDNEIRVYDSNNVLRVRLGVWT